MSDIVMEFDVFTDGSCRYNPGPGAYSYIILFNGETLYKYSEGFTKTTNNRMELMAIIKALEYLKLRYKFFKCNIFSDSKYVTDTFNKNWIGSWIKNGFKKVKNVDLWKEYIKISEKIEVKYVWVKGHKGVKYNEECDKMASKSIDDKVLRDDVGYIN